MSNQSDRIPQLNRTSCFFCGSDGPIERHHLAPQRHGGPDEEWNLVDVCRNCHGKLERLYTDRVWSTADTVPDRAENNLRKDMGADEVRVVSAIVRAYERDCKAVEDTLVIETLQLNGVSKSKAQAYIEHAVDRVGVIPTEKRDKRYLQHTNRYFDGYEPILDQVDLLSERCPFCEQVTLVISGPASKDDPVCSKCRLDRLTQQRRADNGPVD